MKLPDKTKRLQLCFFFEETQTYVLYSDGTLEIGAVARVNEEMNF